jgi:2,4-dienoyl-CoA reductase-like NADH-dependent reductase (Old Yellow Enzyme family)
MPTLNDPIRIGDLDLPNRVLMAPLTRSRATEDRVPTDLMLEYYVQRASAGLIISEATCISPLSVGYERTPGIWSDEQVAGWRRITDAVHNAGGRISLQLWHVGRISHPILLDGETPVAPSAIAPEGRVNLLRPHQSYVTPRALAHAEIAGVVDDYRRGAEYAQSAGFDGVELHGANG